MTQAISGGCLAAVVFGRDEDVDAAMAAFVAEVRRGGARVAGFLQRRAGDDVSLCDIETGAEIALMQDLGREAEGCRLDPAALARAAAHLGAAFSRAPDLVIVNRFGKLESEGGGLLAEIGEAVARGVPALVAVPQRFREAWGAFSGGLARELPADAEAMASWWEALGAHERRSGSRARPRGGAAALRSP